MNKLEQMDYSNLAKISEEEFEQKIAHIKTKKEQQRLRTKWKAAQVMAERKKSDPIFSEVNRLLLKAGDKLQYIIQGDHIPQTSFDYAALDSIVHHMYRFVRLAGQMGIKVDVVWEKTAGRHGMKMEMPEHLKNPNKPDKKNFDDIEDAQIIDDNE